MTPSSSAPVVLRSRHLDKAAATALATALETLLWPPPDAVAMVQDSASDDCWTVEAIFAAAPDAGALEQAGIDATALACATLPDIDWVSATLERLKPIRAGRFLLHGSHDRARRPPGGIAIEIDAGTAFGTGHHATTLGCLLALDDLLEKRRPGGYSMSAAAAASWRSLPFARLMPWSRQPTSIPRRSGSRGPTPGSTAPLSGSNVPPAPGQRQSGRSRPMT